MDLSNSTLAIVGLGYVGLPLAVEFGKQRPVLGFDINPARIAELQAGRDHTLECSPEELASATHLRYSSSEQDLKEARVFIVTVPTPVDSAKRPDLSPLIAASRTVGRVLGKGDVVIFESTVFPGATEEVCVPELERVSGLVFNQDFYCGYSPERINPGDKAHRVSSIKKVTSGSTLEAAEAVDQLYARIITAGTHKASSIKVAEAAKVIENTQRDLNIALMNELAVLFNKLDIDNLDDKADLTRLRLRAGYDMGRFMPYATLGAAKISGEAAGVSISETRPTYGIGVDFQATDKITVGGEYTYQKWKDVADLDGVNVDAKMFQLRASYRF